MELSIIVVNYCNHNLTEKCVNSVIENTKGLEYEIIVIDNNSTNESFNVLKELYANNEKVKVIHNDKNVGFGRANNIAVDRSEGEYILFLNPDIIIFDNSIKLLHDKIVSDSDIGLISCKLLNMDMSLQYSCRKFIKFNKFVLARTPLNIFLSHGHLKKINDEYLGLDYDHEKEIEVDWLMGSCMMLRKEFFLKIGKFSKQYFMYFEDVDLCYKVHKNGKKVLYFPTAKMIHLHNQESTKKLNKLSFIHLSSMIKFYFFRNFIY